MRLADEMLRNDLEISKTESELSAMKEAIRQMAAGQNELAKQRDEQREQQIRDDFKKDPDVIALTDEIASAVERLDHAKSLARQAHDPARRAADQRYKKLMDQYNLLWKEKYEELGARLKSAGMGDHSEQSVAGLEVKLRSLKEQKQLLIKLFNQMKVDEKTVNNDTFEATFLSRQLDTLQRDAEHLNNNIKELQFKASQEDFRVSQVDQAIARQVPTNNKRLKYVAAVPICLLLMVLGLFFLLEIKGERVGDPDALSTRVRALEVFALPPLPTARAIRKLSVSEADDQIEQFIQRLDHLRFAVCGNPSELGTRTLRADHKRASVVKGRQRSPRNSPRGVVTPGCLPY